MNLLLFVLFLTGVPIAAEDKIIPSAPQTTICGEITDSVSNKLSQRSISLKEKRPDGKFVNWVISLRPFQVYRPPKELNTVTNQVRESYGRLTSCIAVSSDLVGSEPTDEKPGEIELEADLKVWAEANPPARPVFPKEQIAIENCPSYDFSSHMGPTRDQDGVGYCWAFASAALYEEEICLGDSSRCGKVQISPLDVSRCDFSLTGPNLSKNDGGSPLAALECVTKGGACEEKYSPFNLVHTNEICKTPACNNRKLMDKYEEYKKIHSCWYCRENQILNEIQQLLPQAESLGVDVNKILAQTNDEELMKKLEAERLLKLNSDIKPETLKLFTSNPDLKFATDRFFLKNIFIPPLCEKNRILIKERKVILENFYSPKKSLRERTQSIVSGFKNGRSMGSSRMKVGKTKKA